MPFLTKRLIDASKPIEKPLYIWDSGERSVKGFGLQVLPSGVKSFVLQYRADGASRRMTIGRYGEQTVDVAREKAARFKSGTKDGVDPLAQRKVRKEAARAEKIAETMSELLDRYLRQHVALRNAASTAKITGALVDRFIRPAVGKIKVKDFARKDAAELHYSMRSTPRQANLALALLSKSLSLAEEWGLRPENSNPCGSVTRYPEMHRERFLTADEIRRLGEALEEAATVGLPWHVSGEDRPSKHLAREENRRTKLSWQAIAAVRLLLLTGARLSEILGLAWTDVDLLEGTIALPGRKGGGRKPHPVGSAALDILRHLPQVKGSPYVLPRDSDPKRHVSKEVLESAWQRLRTRARFEDVRLHDLRHTVGTFAAQAGVSGFIVRDLLRHRNVATTGRYANFDANPVRDVSNVVGERIAASLAGSSVKHAPDESK